MKTYITFFIFSFTFLSVNAQAYKSAFRADVCDCLTEESLKRTLTENAFKRCLREALPKYAAQIDAQIVEPDTDKKFYKGQLARKELLVAMQYELIYSCDVYFKHLDYQRTSKKLIARENVKESDLEKYNQMVALTPNAMAYFMRAQVQFKLGNIKATEADINKSLEVNPNKENTKATRHELLLLAFVYEEQKKFADAVTLYDKIYLGDFDVEAARLRALADKKSGGTLANIPKVSQAEIKNDNKTTSRRRSTQRQESSRGIETKSTKTTKSRSKTIKPKAKKKKDTTSLRKLFKMRNG